MLSTALRLGLGGIAIEMGNVQRLVEQTPVRQEFIVTPG